MQDPGDETLSLVRRSWVSSNREKRNMEAAVKVLALDYGYKEEPMF